MDIKLNESTGKAAVISEQILNLEFLTSDWYITQTGFKYLWANKDISGFHQTRYKNEDLYSEI